MKWLIVLLAGVIGGLGVAGIIRSALAKDRLVGLFDRASGELPLRRPTSISLAGGAGAAAETGVVLVLD